MTDKRVAIGTYYITYWVALTYISLAILSAIRIPFIWGAIALSLCFPMSFASRASCSLTGFVPNNEYDSGRCVNLPIEFSLQITSSAIWIFGNASRGDLRCVNKLHFVAVIRRPFVEFFNDSPVAALWVVIRTYVYSLAHDFLFMIQ